MNFRATVGAWMLLSLNLAAHAEDPVTKVLADWKERYQRFESFEYQCDGTVFEPRGSVTQNAQKEDWLPKHVHGPLPAEDLKYDAPLTLLIDMKNGRVRKEVGRPIFASHLARYVPHWQTMLFDGKEYQSYTPREKNSGPGFTRSKFQPDLTLEGHRTSYGFTWPVWPILLAHGIIPIGHVAPDALSYRPRVDLWTWRGTAKVDEAVCDVLQIEHGVRGDRSLQFWADRSRHSAVCRIVWVWNEDETARFEIEHERVEDEWLPSRWKRIVPLPDLGSRTAWEEYVVKERRLNLSPKLEEFQIQPKTGEVVNDRRNGERYFQGRPGEPNVPITPEMQRASFEKHPGT